MAEKKRLTQDDYSMIQRNAEQTSPSETPRVLDIQHSTDPTSESPVDQPKSFDRTSEDVVQHRRTTEEIGADTTEKQIGDDQTQEEWNMSKPVNQTESSSVVSPTFNQAARFTLVEVEEILGRRSNSDELERFAGERFLGIEQDLDQSLSDLQRSNLLRGDKLAIEDLISRKLTSDEEGMPSNWPV